MDRRDWSTAIEMLVPEIHLPDEALLQLLGRCVPEQQITSMAEAQALLLRNFRVGGAQQCDCADWLTAVTRDLLASIPLREVFVILALFLPQLPFAEGARVDNQLWSSPVIQQMATEVQVTPVAQGLRGMNEYRIAFPAHSRAAAFCSPDTTVQQLNHLASIPPEKIRIGCQVGKVYRIVFLENAAVFAILGVLLEYVAQPKKKSKQGGAETYEESTARYSSPKSWIVAVIPVPETFAPLPSREEIGTNIAAVWDLPPCMKDLTPCATTLRILSLAEVGSTASADHLLQMATMPLEHKTTALGIPYSCPVSYHFDGSDVLQQSLHSLFALLLTGDTPRYIVP